MTLYYHGIGMDSRLKTYEIDADKRDDGSIYLNPVEEEGFYGDSIFSALVNNVFTNVNNSFYYTYSDSKDPSAFLETVKNVISQETQALQSRLAELESFACDVSNAGKSSAVKRQDGNDRDNC